MTTMTTR